MKAIIYLFILSSTLFSSSITVQLPVKYSEPLYRTITKKVPYQECYDKTENIKVPDSYNNDTNGIGIDTLIGITAGIVLGNQIGRGNGRSAAKVLGGIAGGLVSNGMRENSTNYHYEERTRRVCETHYESSSSKRLIGYKLCAEIEGKKICTSSKEMLSLINVHISAY